MKENETKTTNKSNWGTGITILYSSFVLFILFIVLIAALQDYDLVHKDYYQKEIAYQEQIDRVNRTNSLTDPPRVEYLTDEGAVLLHFPDSATNNSLTGSVVFFRPSDASLDRKVVLELDSKGQQKIQLQRLSRGNWKMQLYWAIDSVDYYYEESIYIG